MNPGRRYALSADVGGQRLRVRDEPQQQRLQPATVAARRPWGCTALEGLFLNGQSVVSSLEKRGLNTGPRDGERGTGKGREQGIYTLAGWGGALRLRFHGTVPCRIPSRPVKILLSRGSVLSPGKKTKSPWRAADESFLFATRSKKNTCPRDHTPLYILQPRFSLKISRLTRLLGRRTGRRRSALHKIVAYRSHTHWKLTKILPDKSNSDSFNKNPVTAITTYQHIWDFIVLLLYI